jgi:hypothetical protein
MRWFNGKSNLGRRGVAAAAAMLMAVGVAACGDETLTDANTSTALGDSDASAILSDMAGDLGLTDDQRSELQAIAQEYSSRMGEPGVTWYAAADVQAVLASEQIATIDARRQELRDRIADRMANRRALGQGSDGAGMRGRGTRRSGDGARRGIGGGPWVGGDMDLTAEQIDAIQDILETYRPQMEAIRDQVRDGSLTREEARDLAHPIRDGIRTEIEALLTPEQLDALEERRQDFEDGKADREAAREQAHAARVDALGLTAQQQARLDALRDAPKTEGTVEERREAHRTAMAGIMNEAQLEIVAVHQALRGHGMLRRFSGGQGFGQAASGGRGTRGGFGRGFGNGT